MVNPAYVVTSNGIFTPVEVEYSTLKGVQLTIPGLLTPAQMGGMWAVWSETPFC